MDKRTLETTLNGKDVTLAATFSAGMDIASKVADPLFIMNEARLEAMAHKVGLYSHQPKFRFTMENVPQILHIGIKAAGGAMSLEDVQNAVFAEGVLEAQAKAETYLLMLVMPQSEEATKTKAEPSGE